MPSKKIQRAFNGAIMYSNIGCRTARYNMPGAVTILQSRCYFKKYDFFYSAVHEWRLKKYLMEEVEYRISKVNRSFEIFFDKRSHP